MRSSSSFNNGNALSHLAFINSHLSASFLLLAPFPLLVLGVFYFGVPFSSHSLGVCSSSSPIRVFGGRPLSFVVRLVPSLSWLPSYQWVVRFLVGRGLLLCLVACSSCVCGPGFVRGCVCLFVWGVLSSWFVWSRARARF